MNACPNGCALPQYKGIYNNFLSGYPFWQNVFLASPFSVSLFLPSPEMPSSPNPLRRQRNGKVQVSTNFNFKTKANKISSIFQTLTLRKGKRQRWNPKQQRTAGELDKFGQRFGKSGNVMRLKGQRTFPSLPLGWTNLYLVDPRQTLRHLIRKFTPERI